ncbi:hypothetical protein [Agromyces sp. NPDC055658]
MTDIVEKLERELESSEAEVQAARDRAATLENDIINGNTKVKISDIEAEESRARYAELRIQNTVRRLSEAREQLRISEIQSIREEIETTPLDSEQFTRLLQAVEDAQLAFLEAAEARSTQLRAWRKRLRELGVEDFTNSSPREDETLLAPYPTQYSSVADIRVGTGRIGAIDPNLYLTEVFKVPVASRRNYDIYQHMRRALERRS